MIDESLRPAVRLKPFLRILPILSFDSAKYDAQKICTFENDVNQESANQKFRSRTDRSCDWNSFERSLHPWCVVRPNLETEHLPFLSKLEFIFFPVEKWFLNWNELFTWFDSKLIRSINSPPCYVKRKVKAWRHFTRREKSLWRHRHFFPNIYLRKKPRESNWPKALEKPFKETIIIYWKENISN